MNKELIEMMGKRMEQMNEMQSEMKNGFSAVNERIDGLDLKADTLGERFDTLDSKVDAGFNSMKEMLYVIANQFEQGTEQKDARIDEIKQDLKFVTHKLNSVEKDVFNLGGRQ